MTLDQFRYFLETAKFQHVGKAAKSLHISPSAISTAVSALENEFGAELFERKGQGIQLTEKGQHLRSGIERILDQLGELSHSMNGSAERISGTYRLAASHFLAARFLGKTWSRIQKRYPQVSVELNSMSTARTLAEILSGSLDAGLCFSPLRHPDLEARALFRGELKIAVRKRHPLLKKAARERVSLLSQYPAAIHKAASGVDLCVDHPMFDKFGIQADTHCLWDCDDLAVEVMKGTDSWSLLPDIVVHEHRSALEALRPPSGWEAPYFVALVFRSHRGESPFIKLLHQELAKLMPRQFTVRKA